MRRFDKAFRMILALILLVWVTLMIVAVFRIFIQVSWHMLYTQQNRLSSRSLMLSFIIRHSTYLIALLASLFLIGLYFFSFNALDFLKCAYLLLTVTGMATTVWNVDMLFYAPYAERILWLRTFDVMMLLYLLFAYWLLSSWAMPKMRARRLWGMGFLGVSACACAAVLILPPIHAEKAILPYCCLAAVFTLALYTAHCVQEKTFDERHKSILLLLIPIGMTALLSANRYNMGGRYYQFINQYGSQPFVFFAVFLSAIAVTRQFSTLFFRRSQNKRFQEVMRINANVSNMLTTHLRGPAEQIASLSSLALSDGENGAASEQQHRILRQIQESVRLLTRHLSNIHAYEMLPGSLSNKQGIKINLATMFSYVSRGVQHQNEGAEIRLDDQVDWKSIYVCGEPYALIRANILLLSAICHMDRSCAVRVACKLNQTTACVSFTIEADSRSHHEIKNAWHILESGWMFDNQMKDDTEASLWMAGNIFARQGSKLRTSMIGSGKTSSYQCTLPLALWTDAKDAVQQKSPVPKARFAGNRCMIALISSSSEEIELVSLYLASEPYDLLVISSDSEAFRGLPDIANLSVVIVGTTFLKATIFDICRFIRGSYVISQIPILLLQRDQDVETHLPAYHLANDIIVGIFGRFEFNQKVQSLVALNESIQDALLSRIAFLQAQMDPHFIFNTMTTIMAMCLREPKDAYELMGYFSEYLRSSLFPSGLGKPAPLWREIDLIGAYLCIEKARFGETIEYELIADVAEEREILPLLIEPLVENCVKHGMVPNRKLSIRVEITESGNTMHVLVHDDGEGIEPKRLIRITSEESEKSGASSRSIGLNNVRTRLKIYYGETLHVSSTPGKGTTVSFSLKF